MKKLFCVSVLLFACLTSFEQNLEWKDVPAPVMAKFKAFYSEVKKAKWEKEGNNYEAKFKGADKKQICVVYTPEGNIYEKVWKIKKTELPQAVLDSLAKKFPGAKPEDCEKIDRNGLLLYEVEFEMKEKGKEEVEMKIEFTPTGKIWAKKSETESKEKKKEGGSSSSPQAPKKEVKKDEPKKDDKKDQK